LIPIRSALAGRPKKSPIFIILEPILGIFTFFMVLAGVAYGVSLVGINGGSIALFKIDSTSIGFNILGSLALLVGIAWIFAVVRAKSRCLVARNWTVALGLVIAFSILRMVAVVHGGEMDTAGSAQLLAVTIAFVGFWLGFYGVEKNTVVQAMFVFGTLTVIYWLLDLTAIPTVVASGAPITNFAGGGLLDSDFVYPFSAAVGYVVAKWVLRILARAAQVLEDRFVQKTQAEKVLYVVPLATMSRLNSGLSVSRAVVGQ
jgi:hypothetical protein